MHSIAATAHCGAISREAHGCCSALRCSAVLYRAVHPPRRARRTTWTTTSETLLHSTLHPLLSRKWHCEQRAQRSGQRQSARGAVANSALCSRSPRSPGSASFESTIAALGRDNAQLLFNRIFELPTEPIPHDVGKLALLPPGSTPLPREKPVPKPAPPTKWEAFAKLKGIEKQKRSRMVTDAATGEIAPRFGYKSARSRAEDAEWAIEAPKGAETGAIDPWTQQSADKKARVAKNKKQQDRNILKSAAKGSKNRVDGAIDLKSAVDLSATKLGLKNAGSRKKESSSSSKKKEKHHVDLALGVAQKSTASQGRFDSLRVHEPQIQLPKAASNKAQRHDASERSRSRPEEKNASLSLLSKVLTGQKDNDNYGPNQRVNMDKIKSMGQQQNEAKNIEKKRKVAASASHKGGKQNRGGAGGGGASSSKKKDGGSNKKQRR